VNAIAIPSANGTRIIGMDQFLCKSCCECSEYGQLLRRRKPLSAFDLTVPPRLLARAEEVALRRPATYVRFWEQRTFRQTPARSSGAKTRRLARLIARPFAPMCRAYINQAAGFPFDPASIAAPARKRQRVQTFAIQDGQHQIAILGHITD
jgi:hypothetical protein